MDNRKIDEQIDVVRAKYLDEIRNIFRNLEIDICNGKTEMKGEWGEIVFMKILEKMFNYHLKWLEKVKPNHPAVDLGDEKNDIAFQITVECENAKKIRETISREIVKKYKKRILLILTSRPKRNHVYSQKKMNEFMKENFNPKEDVWYLTTLIEKMKDMEFDKLEEVYRCIKKEFTILNKENAESPQLRTRILLKHVFYCLRVQYWNLLCAGIYSSPLHIHSFLIETGIPNALHLLKCSNSQMFDPLYKDDIQLFHRILKDFYSVISNYMFPMEIKGREDFYSIPKFYHQEKYKTEDYLEKGDEDRFLDPKYPVLLQKYNHIKELVHFLFKELTIEINHINAISFDSGNQSLFPEKALDYLPCEPDNHSDFSADDRRKSLYENLEKAEDNVMSQLNPISFLLSTAIKQGKIRPVPPTSFLHWIKGINESYVKQICPALFSEADCRFAEKNRPPYGWAVAAVKFMHDFAMSLDQVCSNRKYKMRLEPDLLDTESDEPISAKPVPAVSRLEQSLSKCKTCVLMIE